MSLTAFSQNAIVNKKVCFPDSIAKKIAVDLVKGDSAIAELKVTQELVKQLEDINATNKQAITSYVKKMSLYEDQINLFKQKEKVYVEIQTGLEGDVVRLKNRNKFLKISVGVLTITTAVGFLIH
jgi:hypothetical protein